MAGRIKTVGVIGTGVIGSSWVTLFLAKGLKVLVSDPAPGAAANLEAFVKREWSSMERIGLNERADPANLRFVGDVADHMSEVDYVQENGPENKDFKSKLFARLDAQAGLETILASSSSGIPSSQFVAGCKKASGRVLIGHPFNPPHLVPLVEVVPHPGTQESIVQRALDFYRSLGKQPIWVKQECPGFIANRLQAAIASEAYSLVDRGIVSASDLDKAVTTGLGLRWALTGPFMTNLLGGGGGKEGFLHLLQHLGPAIQTWKQDMDNNKFDFTDESVRTLNKSVMEMIKYMDLIKMEKERVSTLISLIEMKSQRNALP